MDKIVMLASTYDPVKHECCKCNQGLKCMYVGFLCSEKYDGYRAYYCSKTKKMFSRNNKEFFIPEFFIKDFPDIDLDGELWIDRVSFEKMGLVRNKIVDDIKWIESGVKYIVFDAPNINGTFVQRLEILIKSVKDSKFIEVAPQEPIINIKDVYEKLQIVKKNKGEGLMLRDPNGKYEWDKRSKTILKIKPFSDAEAIVVGFTKGLGKYSCKRSHIHSDKETEKWLNDNKINTMIGGLICKTIKSHDGPEENIEIVIGSGLNDNLRNEPPKVGSIITYKFYDLTKNGIPRHAIYKGFY